MEQMRDLINKALRADEEIEHTGEVYRAEDVHGWMERLARNPAAARPRPGRQHFIRAASLVLCRD